MFFKKEQLRVLLYHKVSENGRRDFLTVTNTHLEAQFHYLQQHGYTTILLSELVDHVTHGTPLPPKAVLITFDDGYRDNYTLLYPLLKKYGLKANIFLVPAFLQKESSAQDVYLQLSDLLAMDPQTVEYGLHSFDHKDLRQLSPDDIAQDIHQCKEYFTRLNIPFQHCLAFPYGAYPKRNRAKLAAFFNTLQANNIVLAFRIGNRLNPLPLRRPLLVQRLDIRGDEEFQQFERKMRKGKRLF